MARFSGKRVLISGGSNGIGLAGAHRLADEDAQVMITGTNPERLESARSAIPRVKGGTTTQPIPAPVPRLRHTSPGPRRVWTGCGSTPATPTSPASAR